MHLQEESNRNKQNRGKMKVKSTCGSTSYEQVAREVNILPYYYSVQY